MRKQTNKTPLLLAAAMGASLGLASPPAAAKSYKGAEVYGLNPVRYGRMEMRMRMVRGSGLLSSFFTYKNGSEVAGTVWEEIDIEIFGKNPKTWQSNIITGNPKQTSEQVHTASDSLADGFHTYAVEWTPDYVAWYVDGAQVRKTQGGQVGTLTNGETLRFNAWSSESADWVGPFDANALPAYQFINWIKYYRYANGQFTLDWTDDFNTFDSSRWARGDWTFDGNRVDFDPANAVIKDGMLILAITREGQTGFNGQVPTDNVQPDAGVPDAGKDAGAGGTGGSAGAGGTGGKAGSGGTGGGGSGGSAGTGGSGGKAGSGGNGGTGGTAGTGGASGGSAGGGNTGGGAAGSGGIAGTGGKGGSAGGTAGSAGTAGVAGSAGSSGGKGGSGPTAGAGGGGGASGSGGATGTGVTTSSNTSTKTGGAQGGTSGAGGSATSDTSGGCACSLSARHGGPAPLFGFLLAGLALLGLRRRR